jgi:hypothetical protein
MRDSRIQKIIAVILIFSQLAFWPVLVLAQTAPAGALNPVPTNDSGSTVSNTAFNVALKPIQAIYSTCNSVLQGFETGDKATQIGFSFATIIGGGGALATAYLAEINAYSAYLDCLEGWTVTGVLPALNALPAPNLVTDNVKGQMITQVKTKIQTYEAKLKTSEARYSVASQNIWKALLITVLLNTTKVVADQLVNKLVNNYKITNLKAYTDSVATLMYDNQFIRDNYPSTQDQLMARSILENPLFRTQVPPGLFVQADTALGYTSLDPNDPYFYSNLAKAGFAATNPYYLQTSYVAGVDQAHGSAITTAQAHIAQGSGYKAPVNCAGSLAQQKQIDATDKAASDALAYASGQLTSLQQAKQLNPNSVSSADLAKAQAAYDAANKTWQNLPYTVTGNNSVSNLGVSGGNNTEGTAAIVMCEAVNSPAVLVNQGIDAVFKSLNLGNYNNSNLPGFLSAISGIATQIGSSLVLGGITGSPVNINENAVVAQAVTATQAATIQTLNNNAQANMAKGIQFDGYPNSSVTNGYTLNWTVVTQQIPSASYVTITGPGITGTPMHMPLSGSQAVVAATAGNYTLNVYDATNKLLVSALVTVSPTQVSYNSGAPAVAGAFTATPVVSPRGPTVVIAPRGEPN